MLYTLSKYTVSLFGVGFLKPASGTWGTLATVPIAYLIAVQFSPFALILASFIAFIIGWIATAIYEKHSKKHDASEVVIDEMAGMFLTLALIPVDIELYVIGFFVFRFFDIIKPFPARTIDRQKTPFSVMLDDVIAGIYSMIVVWILWQTDSISHIIDSISHII